MSARRNYAVALAAIVSMGWLFLGFDHYAGDHESGGSWDLFVKSSPSLRVFFDNPAQRGLDFVPFDELDALRRTQMRSYCAIRFGAHEMVECYRRVSMARY